MASKQMISVDEAAKLLNIAPITLYRLVSGKMSQNRPPHLRVGRRIVFEVEPLLEWYRQGGEKEETSRVVNQ